jgi:hypothetical protein
MDASKFVLQYIFCGYVIFSSSKVTGVIVSYIILYLFDEYLRLTSCFGCAVFLTTS